MSKDILGNSAPVAWVSPDELLSHAAVTEKYELINGFVFRNEMLELLVTQQKLTVIRVYMLSTSGMLYLFYKI